MQLKHLFDAEAQYSEPIDMLFPFGGKVGQGFGGGSLSVTGEQLTGSGTWSNYPSIREDGAAIPTLTGIIRTVDGSRVLIEIGGYSILNPDGDQRMIVGGAKLLSDNDKYAWLNRTYLVVEGFIERGTGTVRARFYECIPEM